MVIINKEKLLNVVLRVSSLFIAEAWYKTNAQSLHQLVFGGDRTTDPSTNELFILRFIYYAVIVLAATIAILPVERLISFYMHLVCAFLVASSHRLSHLYVEEQVTSNSGRSSDLGRTAAFLVGHMALATLVSELLGLRQWTTPLVLSYVTPVVAGAMGFEPSVLHTVHGGATVVMIVSVVGYALQQLPRLISLAMSTMQRTAMAIQVFGWIPVAMPLIMRILNPPQFVTFWLVLFGLQLFKFLGSGNHPIIGEGWVVVLLASISECCTSPTSLAGLCVTVSYVAYLVLSTTRIFLTGRGGFLHDNPTNQGWLEACTMFILSIQTGITELRATERAFLLSIVLFIVCSSLIQSMYEITEPFLLELSASPHRSISKHVRAVLLCTFLWIFPLYMAHTICQYFPLDFWLLIIVSSCLLTSVQVLGSLAVYVLFMYDSLTQRPWESLDDVVYYAKGTTRVLEFIVAVFVVAYGAHESIFGQWSWIYSSILVLHCYFNVWQRLQAGWKSYLLRREAVKRIESLPAATEEQLANHNDLCAICLQELKSACVTPCNHFFHTVCLRKWLYVQECCPLCYQKLDTSKKNPERTESGEEDTSDVASPPEAEETGAGHSNTPRETQVERRTEDGQETTGIASPSPAGERGFMHVGQGDSLGAGDGPSSMEKQDSATVTGLPRGTGDIRDQEEAPGHSRSSSRSTEENYVIVGTRQSVEGDMHEEQEAERLQQESLNRNRIQ